MGRLGEYAIEIMLRMFGMSTETLKTLLKYDGIPE